MAWFRKEKKPRLPRRDKLEIPADVWEKCEACGHTDIREKFVRNLNVCPQCEYHRRIRAIEYVTLLLDDGSFEEVEENLRSVDPLGFPDYPARLKRAQTNAGDQDAILTVQGALGGLPVHLGVMDFSFMGGSMGSVVGEKIARLGQRSLERKYPLLLVSASGGARMQERMLPAHLSKIMEEILNNAFKYSKSGTPVEVVTQRQGDEMWLTVKDNGRGMSSDEIAGICAFQQFQRKQYEQQGLGLGLVIAQRLLELYRGKLAIESEPGVYTSVRIVLPAATSEATY